MMQSFLIAVKIYTSTIIHESVYENIQYKKKFNNSLSF